MCLNRYAPISLESLALNVHSLPCHQSQLPELPTLNKLLLNPLESLVRPSVVTASAVVFASLGSWATVTPLFNFSLKESLPPANIELRIDCMQIAQIT